MPSLLDTCSAIVLFVCHLKGIQESLLLDVPVLLLHTSIYNSIEQKHYFSHTCRTIKCIFSQCIHFCLLSAIFVINLFNASIIRGKDNCPFIENMLEKHIDQFLFYPVCLCNLTLYFYPCI